jgi:uncharacterized protein YndB with AHSA1/START domain
MSDHTVRLHRVLRCKPEKVYRAFLEAGAMAKWLTPYGFTCTVHHMEARVGGTFRMSFWAEALAWSRLTIRRRRDCSDGPRSEL